MPKKDIYKTHMQNELKEFKKMEGRYSHLNKEEKQEMRFMAKHNPFIQGYITKQLEKKQKAQEAAQESSSRRGR